MREKIYNSRQCFLRENSSDDLKRFTKNELELLSSMSGYPIEKNEYGVKSLAIDDYADSENFSHLVRALKDLGRTVSFGDDPRSLRRRDDVVIFALVKEFTQEEFDSSEFFFCQAKETIAPIETDLYWDLKEGTPLEAKSFRKSKKIGSVGCGPSGFSYRLVCVESIVDSMKEENFSGFDFQSVPLVKKNGDKVSTLEEVVSNVKLPQLMNTFTDAADSVDIGYPESGNCYLFERSSPPILKLSDDLLNKIKTADVMRTFETFGSVSIDVDESRYRFPAFVVSSRFRNWALKNKLQLKFSPVALVM